MTPREHMDAALHILSHWRRWFAALHLGPAVLFHQKQTRELIQVRAELMDQERMLTLRAEVSAIAALLVHKGIATQDEIATQIGLSALATADALTEGFPGIKALDVGLGMRAVEAEATMRAWGLLKMSEHMPSGPDTSVVPVGDTSTTKH